MLCDRPDVSRLCAPSDVLLIEDNATLDRIDEILPLKGVDIVFLGPWDMSIAEPMPLIILAGQRLNEEDRTEEAMRIINQAIDVARRSGTFWRLAFGVKARIALRLHDYQVVQDVLRQIMELKFTRGNVDIGAERDFLDQLPPGSVDPLIAQEYDRSRGQAPDAGWLGN